MEPNIELLNRFGTDYPEPEETADDLRKKYYDLLAEPWTQRGTGLASGAFLSRAILLSVLAFLAGGLLLILFVLSGAAGESGKILLAVLSVVVWGIVLGSVLLYALPLWNINHRTRAHSFREHPAVRHAAVRLADASPDEALREYIPVLKINGRTLFYVAYVKKSDPTKTPSGIIIFDDQGRAVEQDEALEKAKLTACISITCGQALQQRAETVRRAEKKIVERQIPEAVKILRAQEQQFAEHALSAQLAAVLEAASILPQALQASISILDGQAAFRKAMGYSFALEFHYEDAMKLRELYLAYVRYLNAAYRRKIIALTTTASDLIQTLGGMTDWQNRDGAITALSTLAVAGPSGVLSRICQKEYEGIVNDEERKAFHEKTLQAKALGLIVISGVWRQRQAWQSRPQ